MCSAGWKVLSAQGMLPTETEVDMGERGGDPQSSARGPVFLAITSTRTLCLHDGCMCWVVTCAIVVEGPRPSSGGALATRLW